VKFKIRARHPDNVAAHANEDVQCIVAAVLAYPVSGMIALLARTLYSDYVYGEGAIRHHLNEAAADVDLDAARELAGAAMRIANLPVIDRRLCRGAVVEAISEALIKSRPGVARVEIEEQIGPLQYYTDELSPSFDVVVHGEPLEAYECKSNPMEIVRDNLWAIRDVVKLAEEEDLPEVGGRRAAVGFVTLQTRAFLLSAVIDWLDGPLWCATVEDLFMLGSEPASAHLN
jgi:hypothetical protein